MIGLNRLVPAAVALTFAFSIASAAAAEDCLPIGAGLGQPIMLSSPMDEDTTAGLTFSLQAAISDSRGGDWPKDVMGPAGACTAGSAKAASGGFTIYGGTGREPPRWARLADGSVIFLAAGPGLEESAVLAKIPPSGRFPVRKAAFYLVTSADATRRIVRLYDVPPLDAVLAKDFETAAAAGFPMIADVAFPSLEVTFAPGLTAAVATLPKG